MPHLTTEPAMPFRDHYFDPREQPIREKGPQPAPPCSIESARVALDAMHRSRAIIVADVAGTNLRVAIDMLLDLYPDQDTHRALELFARLGDEHGSATVNNTLRASLAHRGRR